MARPLPGARVNQLWPDLLFQWVGLALSRVYYKLPLGTGASSCAWSRDGALGRGGAQLGVPRGARSWGSSLGRQQGLEHPHCPTKPCLGISFIPLIS